MSALRALRAIFPTLCRSRYVDQSPLFIAVPHSEDPTQYRQVQELFLELLDTPPSERDQALERRAATDPELSRRVALMLASEPGSSLDESFFDRGGEPRRFGPYEVVRTVARGGMGEVVVAKRIDGEYEREVAIKVMRVDHASQLLLKRFLRERQTLARLDHEYIARLLDGGTTEGGEPYLVMEYVDGEQADVFAAKLDLRERLELLVRICEAVEHAHQLGVVHRDLKPSNILVRPDGKPRLLDFGIARPEEEPHRTSSESLTRTGHRLFTPEFASPEQVRGESVTPQSDQFSLGVLLYLFLCGESPWGKARDLHDLERAIVSSDPLPPSRRLRGTARRRLPRDLDAIALQCLEKRPARRYASVAELREDLRRHLAGRPVRARRIHTLERAGRFVARNPLIPVAAILLIVAGVAALAAWRSTEREADRRDELVGAVRDRVETSRDKWFAGSLDDADAELGAALDAARELPGEDELLGSILAQMAINAGLRKEWARALELVDDAEAALERTASVDHEVILQLLLTRSNAHFHTADGPPSEEHSLAALRYAREHMEPGNALRVDAILGWSDELRRKGRTEEALALVDDVIAEVREFKPQHKVLGRFLNHRAVVLAECGRAAEAIDEYRNVLEAIGWHHGEGHPAFGSVRLNLASALFRVGRRGEAQPEYEKSLANCRVNQKTSLVAANLHFLARVHLWRGELDVARRYVLEAIELRKEPGLGAHLDRSRVILALIDEADGRAAAARAILEPFLASAQAGDLLPDVEADARRAHGTMLLRKGRLDDGRAELERALELCEGAPHVYVDLRSRIQRALAGEFETR